MFRLFFLLLTGYCAKGLLPLSSCFNATYEMECINPLPDMSILGFSNSAANKDMILKI